MNLTSLKLKTLNSISKIIKLSKVSRALFLFNFLINLPFIQFVVYNWKRLTIIFVLSNYEYLLYKILSISFSNFYEISILVARKRDSPKWITFHLNRFFLLQRSVEKLKSNYISHHLYTTFLFIFGQIFFYFFPLLEIQNYWYLIKWK